MAVWVSLIIMALCSVTVMADDTAQEAPEAASETVQNVTEGTEEYEEEEIFSQWNESAPALQTLIDYVEAVTDENSADYIPPVDRVAVFDMDGTLCGELFPTYFEYYALAWRILKDPAVEPDEEMLAVGRTLRDCALDKSFPEDMPMQHAIQAARAYAGMTLNEFSDFVTELTLRDADGFEGMTYGEAFYLPMIEVIDYLQENDFKVYVVSGSDRFLCRTLLEGTIDVPYENVIGMDVEVKAIGQGDVDGLDYVYTSNDDVIRSDKLLIKNLKMNKVCQIVQEIGRQPVLSFGNSSGDVSMHMYTITKNKYKSAAFMLVADDDVRDYGDPEKTKDLRAKWEDSGFNVISMRDDFKTIYGEDVVKTGTFRWMDELADDRGTGVEELKVKTENAPDGVIEHSEESVEEQSEEADGDVQYVLYVGTNSKDTGEPVYSQEECLEKAKEILIEELGGYTIQEAEGGWLDEEGEHCQEYTMVIYLSDTNLEKVHEVCDIMLEKFNQSTILIQENPTSTEFYSGK